MSKWRRAVGVAALAAATAFGPAPTAHAAAGDLDLSFSGDGTAGPAATPSTAEAATTP
ncbi:hypothetical protein [Streptomyces sp. NPDC091371]|uniref:hypothetical protein n=1 Tax=Streptomyces sp. NPDC091371 TaxID=3155303 RepID=UPI003445EF74